MSRALGLSVSNAELFRGEIRLGKEEIGHITLFGGVTGVYPRDCIIDRKRKRVILVIERGRVGLAIGRRGKNLRRLKDATGNRYEIAEYPADLATFLESLLKPVKPRDIIVLDHPRKGKIVFISVKPRDRGACLGKGGRNIEKISMLAKRYFVIDEVKVVTFESAKRVKELDKSRKDFEAAVAKAKLEMKEKQKAFDMKCDEKHRACHAEQMATENKRTAFHTKAEGATKKLNKRAMVFQDAVELAYHVY